MFFSVRGRGEGIIISLWKSIFQKRGSPPPKGGRQFTPATCDYVSWTHARSRGDDGNDARWTSAVVPLAATGQVHHTRSSFLVGGGGTLHVSGARVSLRERRRRYRSGRVASERVYSYVLPYRTVAAAATERVYYMTH